MIHTGLPRERITVMTAVNQSYVLPLAVMLRSLAHSLPQSWHLEIRMLTTGLCREARHRLDYCLDGLNLKVSEVRIDTSILDGLKVDRHVSLETYFRLLAPSLFPDIGKILYLDADLIIRHPILDCFQEPLQGAHLLAVPHASRRSAFFASERGVPSYGLLGINPDARTFNAGVMILDLERWRETDTTHKILKYLREYKDHVLWWDQDGLNAVLHSNWLPLHAKWNVMASHFDDSLGFEDSVLDRSTFDAVRGDPGIVHFSSEAKPWRPNYTGPFADFWLQAYEPVAPLFTHRRCPSANHRNS